MNKINLHDPYIIVDQMPNGKVHTFVISPERMNHKIAGLLVADVIANLAKAIDCDQADIVEWVNKELNDPTTEIISKRYMPGN